MTATQSRARWIRVTEVSCVLAFLVLLIGQVIVVVPLVQTRSDFWLLLLSALVAYLSADFLTGFFHWFFDSFYEVDTPLIGKILVAPFREHHTDPRAMTRHDFFELNGNNCMFLLPFMACNIFDEGALISGVMGKGFMLFFSLGIFGTNQFHSWAHCEKTSGIVAWLQKVHLILSPTNHRQHHQGDHTKGYCVTSGWLNPILDNLGFFRLMERVFVIVGMPLHTAQSDADMERIR